MSARGYVSNGRDSPLSPHSPLGQNNLLSDQLVKLSGNTQMQPLGDKVGVKAGGWSGSSLEANCLGA